MSELRPIEPLIITLRNQRVILDADLADVYGVETKRLNEQVKRNIDRFPEDFMFRLTDDEWNNLRSQFATTSHGGRRTFPYAFTEHGAIMAASILNSPEAVTISVFVVRAFVQMRERLAENSEILKRLAEIDSTLLDHDQALRVIWQNLQPLLEPAPAPRKHKIGFDYTSEGE